MQHARFVWTLGLLLVFGLVSFGGGCGPGSAAPMSPEESNQIRESKRNAHDQLKADAKKAQENLQIQSATRRGAHRGR
jgi:hypothetical protein